MKFYICVIQKPREKWFSKQRARAGSFVQQCFAQLVVRSARREGYITETLICAKIINWIQILPIDLIFDLVISPPPKKKKLNAFVLIWSNHFKQTIVANIVHFYWFHHYIIIIIIIIIIAFILLVITIDLSTNPKSQIQTIVPRCVHWNKERNSLVTSSTTRVMSTIEDDNSLLIRKTMKVFKW